MSRLFRRGPRPFRRDLEAARESYRRSLKDFDQTLTFLKSTLHSSRRTLENNGGNLGKLQAELEAFQSSGQTKGLRELAEALRQREKLTRDVQEALVRAMGIKGQVLQELLGAKAAMASNGEFFSEERRSVDRLIERYQTEL